MIIINTTIIFDTKMQDQVLEWIKSTYQPSAEAHGAIAENTLLTRVLGAAEEGTESYALHLWFADMQQADAWNDNDGARLRLQLTQRWGEKVLTFHTYLEVTE